MSNEIKIITLGDIFDNIETEEKAFRFIDYIKDLQQKVEQLEKENEQLRTELNTKNNIINEIEKILSTEMYRDIAVSKSLDKLKELKEVKNEKMDINRFINECIIN